MVTAERRLVAQLLISHLRQWQPTGALANAALLNFAEAMLKAVQTLDAPDEEKAAGQITSLSLKEADTRSFCAEAIRKFADYMGPWEDTSCSSAQLGTFRAISVLPDIASSLEVLQRDQFVVTVWNMFTQEALNSTPYAASPAHGPNVSTARTWRLTGGMLIAIRALNCQSVRPFNLLSAKELVRCATIVAMWEPGTAKPQYSSVQMITGVPPAVAQFVEKLPTLLSNTSMVASQSQPEAGGNPKQLRREIRDHSANQRTSLKPTPRGRRRGSQSPAPAANASPPTGARFKSLSQPQQATVERMRLCMNCFEVGHRSFNCGNATVDPKNCPAVA
jgi:hypothetical protein